MKRGVSKRRRDADLRRKAEVRLPRDYPWKILGLITQDLRDCLPQEDLDVALDVVRKRDVEEYYRLSETWSPQCMASSELRATEFYAKYQISSALKKYQFDGDAEKRRSAALDKFREAEAVCAAYNHTGYTGVQWPEEEDMLDVFSYARHFLERLLGHVTPPQEELTLWSRHGPGANLDTKHGNTSLYDKYREWPYSCTNGALRHARSVIRTDERWLGALEDSYRARFNIPKHAILDWTEFWANVLKPVDGNRITFVPKDGRKDRSIAIEPSMNLYLQLGVDGYIRRRLKRWGVDLDSQLKNQRLAKLGSENWSDPESFVTLDLAAASDTISLGVCRQLLPPVWYDYLMDLRSPQGDLDGETFVYSKVSSMGNGFTFALESAIFTAIVYGCMRTQGQWNREDFAVFGDDIIVKKSVSGSVVKALKLAGFSINPEKSFIEGPFRESCGADFFAGHAVRPIFLERTPTHVMGLWNDINRINRTLQLRLWEGTFLTPVQMQKWIPEAFVGYTGPLSDENFDSYLHVPMPTTAKRRGGYWDVPRIVVTRKDRRATDFLFRKLMASLRPGVDPVPTWSSKTWGGKRLTGAGSVFTVHRSNSVTVGHTVSPAYNWPDKYNDPAG